MTRLWLIVETPRGHDVGHRFLASLKNRDETTIARIAEEASRSPVGAAYISVSRPVTQRLPNGTVREATERIILVGLEVVQLRPEKIEQVQSELASIFPSLDRLIESIDWSSVSRSMLVNHEELQCWSERIAFQNLPITKSSFASNGQPPVPPDGVSRRVPMWLLLAGLAVACAGLFWLPSGKRNVDKQRGKGRIDPVASKQSESPIRELTREWDCTADEVLRSVMRASNWDRRREADGLSVQSGVGDGEVQNMLGKILASKGTERFLVSTAVVGNDGFRRFVESQSVRSAKQYRQLRTQLYDAWEKFRDLKSSANQARDLLTGDTSKDGFHKTLFFVSDYEPEVGLGEHFWPPATPLFDRQDLLIYQLLEDFRKKSTDGGFELTMIGENGGVASSAGDLSGFLRALQGRHDAIRKSLDESWGVAMKAMRKKRLDEDRGVYAVKTDDAYQALGAFIDALATFGPTE